MHILPLTGFGLMAHDSLEPLPAAWECDLASGAIRWSPGVYDLFGLPRGSPITREAALAMYTPESQVLLEQVRSSTIAAKGSFTIDLEIRRLDGALRKMRLTADIDCRNGAPSRLYGTKLDVTDEFDAA